MKLNILALQEDKTHGVLDNGLNTKGNSTNNHSVMLNLIQHLKNVKTLHSTKDNETLKRVQGDEPATACNVAIPSCKARKLTLAKRIAFSLIELMISLITISIIAAAFTPVITKKLSASSITVGSMGGGGITEFAPDCSTWGDDCTLCTSKSCALCVKVCASNEYVNTKDCTCIGCAEVAQNCASCTKDICTKCKDGYYLNNNVCSTCASKYGEYCETCNANECLSCATNYILSDSPTSNEACIHKFTCPNDQNFMEITYNSGSTNEYKLCITRRNMGDTSMLVIPEDIVLVQTQTYCSSSNSNCCWNGTTGRWCNGTDGGYSGCTRTLCNWYAAYKICDEFNYGSVKWRLPTQIESGNWLAHSKNLYENGLMLCDAWENNGSAPCHNLGNCIGALSDDSQYNDRCFPYHIWFEELTSTTANHRTLVSGSFEADSELKASAKGVRCVVAYDKNGKLL